MSRPSFTGVFPMRWMLVALLLAASLTVAHAEDGVRPLFDVPPIEANDTGGIIAWSPAAQRHARLIARDHCAGYGKRAQITSVNARYGNYIAFACQFPRARVVRHHKRKRVVLRVKY